MQIYALFVKTPMKSDIFYQRQATFLVSAYLLFEFLHTGFFENSHLLLTKFAFFHNFDFVIDLFFVSLHGMTRYSPIYFNHHY